AGIATYGQDRAVAVMLGSIKSNIGHTQAAAGVAGVIKMVMALRHGIVPPTLHVDAPSSRVDWAAGAVALAAEAVPWPEAAHPRRAAVSSFGISGTNAHLILEQPERVTEPAPPATVPAVVPWVVSARSMAALDAQVAQVKELDGLPLVDVGYSLAMSRSGLPHRAVLLATGDGFVAGHSSGEVAAAHVAGVLSLPDGCALVSARGRLMADLPAGGAMVALEAAEAEVVPFLTSEVSIAAVNGAASVVVSGDAGAVDGLVARFADRRSRRLRVSHAFHSPLMEPILDGFRAVVEGLSFAAPSIAVVSNLSGADDLCDPGYWVRHVREPVRFADGIAALQSQGVNRFVEVGPGGVLSGMVAQITGADAVAVLRGDRSEETGVLTALARLYTAGATVDWAGLFAGTGARRVDVPTYPFQRERY